METTRKASETIDHRCHYPPIVGGEHKKRSPPRKSPMGGEQKITPPPSQKMRGEHVRFWPISEFDLPKCFACGGLLIFLHKTNEKCSPLMSKIFIKSSPPTFEGGTASFPPPPSQKMGGSPPPIICQYGGIMTSMH